MQTGQAYNDSVKVIALSWVLIIVGMIIWVRKNRP